jgi:hypothetical protein
LMTKSERPSKATASVVREKRIIPICPFCTEEVLELIRS